MVDQTGMELCFTIHFGDFPISNLSITVPKSKIHMDSYVFLHPTADHLTIQSKCAHKIPGSLLAYDTYMYTYNALVVSGRLHPVR